MESVLQEKITWANAPEEYWWLDVGPFMDRFGEKALGIVSSQDPIVQGVITLLMPRKYIDLKRSDLPLTIDLLISKGLLTVEDKVRVLSLETQDYERHIKGLPQPVGA